MCSIPHQFNENFILIHVPFLFIAGKKCLININGDVSIVVIIICHLSRGKSSTDAMCWLPGY